MIRYRARLIAHQLYPDAMVGETADWSGFATTKEKPRPHGRRMSIDQWHRRWFQGAVDIQESSPDMDMILHSAHYGMLPGKWVGGSSSSLSDICWHLISQKGLEISCAVLFGLLPTA